MVDGKYALVADVIDFAISQVGGPHQWSREIDMDVLQPYVIDLASLPDECNESLDKNKTKLFHTLNENENRVAVVGFNGDKRMRRK